MTTTPDDAPDNTVTTLRPLKEKADQMLRQAMDGLVVATGCSDLQAESIVRSIAAFVLYEKASYLKGEQ